MYANRKSCIFMVDFGFEISNFHSIGLELELGLELGLELELVSGLELELSSSPRPWLLMLRTFGKTKSTDIKLIVKKVLRT